MKVFPSTSRTADPFALSMKRGVPPTDPNARTGELTPPGIIVFASANSLLEVFVVRRATFAPASSRGGIHARGGILAPRDRSVKVNSGISAGIAELSKH